jgi:hypothetical protein
VEASRGPLKKLQLLIPGLRGYRKLEDIRVSDELLRNQTADKLDRARQNVEQVRKQLAASNDLTNLTAVGSLVSQIQALSGEVRHAQQGYSGWVAPISIDEGKLNKLYEYDYAFVSSVIALADSTGKMIYDPSAPNSIQVAVGQLSNAVRDIRQKWSTRLEAVEGIAIG